MVAAEKPEQDRENLLRDATALTHRIELKVADYHDSIVVGFRDSSAASFFFGADPVYHFNSMFELRRAFVDGLLYKADRRRLVSLRRNRTDQETQLIRCDLNDEQQEIFVANADRHLQLLATALQQGSITIIGQLPHNVDLIQKVHDCLGHLKELRFADSPRVS
jgi:hypothetical protein